MATEKFLWRHIGPRPEDIENMLKVVGVSSLDELIEQTVPESIRLKKPLDLPAPLTEFEFISRMKAVASKINYTEPLSVKDIMTRLPLP